MFVRLREIKPKYPTAQAAPAASVVRVSHLVRVSQNFLSFRFPFPDAVLPSTPGLGPHISVLKLTTPSTRSPWNARLDSGPVLTR